MYGREWLSGGRGFLAKGLAKTEKGTCVERVTRLELAGGKVEG